MSQQVLDGPTSHVLGAAVMSIARVVETPPDPLLLDGLDARQWPLRDPESLRGVALMAESRIAAETTERLHADHARLFLGGAAYPAIAGYAAPEATGTSLERLCREVGVLAPAGSPDLVRALEALAALLSSAPGPQTASRRRELLDEHLLTWGSRCFSRAQLGARTFFYQGAATLALGLLSSLNPDTASSLTVDV